MHLCPKGSNGIRLCCLFNLVAKTLSFVKESFHSVCLFALVNILTVQELYVINLQGCVSTYHTAYLCLLESHLYRQHVMCLLKRCQILTKFFMVFLGSLTSVDPHINPILFFEDITVKPDFLITAMVQSLKHISASITLAVYMRKRNCQTCMVILDDNCHRLLSHILRLVST